MGASMYAKMHSDFLHLLSTSLCHQCSMNSSNREAWEKVEKALPHVCINILFVSTLQNVDLAAIWQKK